MLQRRAGYLSFVADGPDESRQLECEGWAVIPGVFNDRELRRLRGELGALFDEAPTVRVNGRTATDYAEYRHESLNRSAAAQAAIGHPAILAVVEPLLGGDCHVIANTTWRNPPSTPETRRGGHWHLDAGPHIPLPDGVEWDPRIPHPVFAIGVHILLQDCDRASGPTGVLAGSHLSGRLPDPDRKSEMGLTYDGRSPVALTGKAGDVAMFVSDVWHRRLDPLPGDQGRFFLQVHYGRRDIAQRIKLTSEVNHLSDAAIARAKTGRERTLVGLHRPGFYDA